MKQAILASAAAGLCLVLGLGACQTPTFQQSNHWRIDSISPRVAYHFFGYVGERDGTAREYTKGEFHSIGTTLQRHLFNDNPDNPLQHTGLGRTDWKPSQKPPPWPENRTEGQ